MPRQLSPNSVLQTLEKISSSRTFRFAARQRSFLRYIVRETLEGRADQLKEYSIGLAVFQKSETFDPRLDSIVRVEARKLRARLRAAALSGTSRAKMSRSWGLSMEFIHQGL